METRHIISMIAFLVLGACSSAAPERLQGELSFAHLSPIFLKAAQLETVLTYESPLRTPHVEHLMPVSPAQAARVWADRRLRTAAGAGKAVFTIREASVRHQHLKTDESLKKLFTTEQADLYTAKLVCVLELYDGQGRRIGQALARAQRTRSGDESLTLNQRDDLWFDMVSDLMDDFDAHMEEAIRTHFTGIASVGQPTDWR